MDREWNSEKQKIRKSFTFHSLSPWIGHFGPQEFFSGFHWEPPVSFSRFHALFSPFHGQTLVFSHYSTPRVKNTKAMPRGVFSHHSTPHLGVFFLTIPLLSPSSRSIGPFLTVQSAKFCSFLQLNDAKTSVTRPIHGVEW